MLVFFITACFAAPSPLPSVGLNNFQTLCSTVLSGPSNAPSYQYCQAAQNALTASNNDSVLWKLWTAVGGVCILACATSYAGVDMYNQWICAATGVAAGITDGVMTQQFINALYAVSGAVSGVIVNKFMSGAKEAGKKTVNRDPGSCLAAASAAFIAYSKYTDMSSQNGTALSNLQSVNSLLSQAAQTQSASTSGSTGTASAASQVASGSTTGATTSSQAVTATATTTPSNGCGTTNTSNITIQCALAADSNLPPYVASIPFAQQFQKTSGTNLGDFMRQSQNPTTALAATLAGSLPAEQIARVTGAYQNMQQQMDSVYKGVGAAQAPKGPDMNDMLATVIGQFTHKAEDKIKGTEEIHFGSPSNVNFEKKADDRISLFDRITRGYQTFHIEATE